VADPPFGVMPGPIVAVADPPFGVMLQTCCLDCPPDAEPSATPWDILDWLSLGISLNDFLQDPSLENLGWLLLDAFGAVLPVFPALGSIRHGPDLIQSATDALKSRAIFVGTSSGKVVPIPKGFTARVADDGKGIVFQKPGSSGNANMVRIMDPKSGYPDGYIVYYERGGQPLDAAGNYGYYDSAGNYKQYTAGDPEVHHGLHTDPPIGYKSWFDAHNK